MERKIFLPFLLAAALFSGGIAQADNWQASIYENGAPAFMVGVDKKKRRFNFFEKNSPLKLRYSYPCVTGQLPGDKQQINDLRTPEGIYFVEYKIANGLDFREYGGIAYTLNYPNPVDRLRGKTGHGIWIHSKGFELVPTRGCVAIGRENIAEVGPFLLPGTPVVLAEELAGVEKNDNGTLAALRRKMGEWSAAWASMSPKLFDFYDPEAYTRATENFAAFRLNKERLFKILTFIKIYNREIHAIEGPGYWVTWSEQFYKASNLSTEGIRRLYWQKDKAGQFRIVGMEWTPRDVGMAAALAKGTLVAELASPVATDAMSEAPVPPKLDMPEQAPAANEADQTLLTSNPLSGSGPLVPRPKEASRQTGEINWGSGKKLNEKKTPAKAATQTPALQLPAKPLGQEKLVLNEKLKKELGQLAASWQEYYQSRDDKIEDFYNAKEYNRLPGVDGSRRPKPLAAAIKNIKQDFRQPWLRLISNQPEVSVNGNVAVWTMPLLVASPQGIRQGEQTLWFARDGKGAFKIVGSDFKPKALGMEASYLEQASDAIAKMLEQWRNAWEEGQLNEYMAFYAPNAVQQGRSGAGNIRRQKAALWSKIKPAQVRLSGLRVALDAKGARVDMTQQYKDSSGRGDKGVKTLYLRFDGDKWLIEREDWSGQPAIVGQL